MQHSLVTHKHVALVSGPAESPIQRLPFTTIFTSHVVVFHVAVGGGAHFIDKWHPGGAAQHAPAHHAEPEVRVQRPPTLRYTKAQMMGVFKALRNARALILPKGVDRSDPYLFGAPDQQPDVLEVINGCHEPGPSGNPEWVAAQEVRDTHHSRFHHPPLLVHNGTTFRGRPTGQDCLLTIASLHRVRVRGGHVCRMFFLIHPAVN
jgi:hypothetical protein